MKLRGLMLSIILIVVVLVSYGCNISDEVDEVEIHEVEDDIEDNQKVEQEEDSDAIEDEDIEAPVEDDKTEEQDGDSTTTVESSYIIEDSNKELVSYLVLSELSSEELRIARNEIYARHGMIFVSDDLVDYFESKEWYEPSVTNFPESELSYTEQVNIQLIREQEEMKTEGMLLHSSAWSMLAIEVENGYLALKTEEAGLLNYIVFTESWDAIRTTEFMLPLSENCTWCYASPLALHEDYSDAIESNQEEIMKLLQDEISAIAHAEANDLPYDTSIGVMFIVEAGEIVAVYQVSS